MKKVICFVIAFMVLLGGVHVNAAINSDMNFININNPKNIYIVGDSIDFTANLNKNVSNLEFTLLVKLNNEEWVETKSVTGKMPEYIPKTSGIYSFHMRIKDEDGYIQNLYIGQAIVYEKMDVIKEIKYEPNEIVLGLEEEIVLKPIFTDEENKNELEYCIKYRYNLEPWSILQDWSNNLNPVSFKQPGIYSLHVDIREKKNNYRIQSIYIGQFAFAEKLIRNHTTLLRELVSTYSQDETFIEDMYSDIYKELDCMINILYSQTKKISALERRKSINNRYFLLTLNEYNIYTINGNIAILDTSNYELRYKGRSFDLSLINNQPIREIFENTQLQDKTMKTIAVFQHLVYNHYKYNKIDLKKFKHFYSEYGHCANLSELLFYLLQDSEYEVRQVGVTLGIYGSHAIVELSHDGKTYTFDPTFNIIYPASVKSISVDKVAPIILPQWYNRYFSWTNGMWECLTSYHIHKSNIQNAK